MKVYFFLMFMQVPILIYSQNGYKIAISTGAYTTKKVSVNSKFQNSSFGKYFELGSSYTFKSNWKIDLQIIKGEYRFFDDGHYTNDPLHWKRNDGTNSKAEDINSSILFGRQFYLRNNLSISIATGIGVYSNIVNYVRKFEYPNRTIWEPFFLGTWSVNFPMNLEMDINIFKRMQLFLKSGAFIEPDFPIMGIHFGGGVKFLL